MLKRKKIYLTRINSQPTLFCYTRDWTTFGGWIDLGNRQTWNTHALLKRTEVGGRINYLD